MKQFNLEEYLANPSRKVVTRDGRKVRIVCTDRKRLNYPIVALIENKPTEGESVLYYTKEGKMSLGNGLSDADLFFAPEKKEGWINIFKGAGASNDNRFLGYTCIFKTKENAEEGRKGVSGYITTIKIEWEE